MKIYIIRFKYRPIYQDKSKAPDMKLNRKHVALERYRGGQIRCLIITYPYRLHAQDEHVCRLYFDHRAYSAKRLGSVLFRRMAIKTVWLV